MNINNLKELVKDCVYAEDGIVCMNNDYYSNILKEIERLNNIINELEKEISNHIALCTDITLNDILDKLKELKGSDKE